MKRLHRILLILLLVVMAPSSRAATVAWDAASQGQFVMCLARDKSGRVWAGTEDKGVWRYEPSSQNWKQFTTRDGLGDDTVYALCVDQLGRVWAGHLNHGVSVFDGQTWRNYDAPDGPIGARVFDISCAPNGDIWIATEAGLTRYSKNDTWRSYTRAEGLPSDELSAIAFDAKGNLFGGTPCDGLVMANASDDYASWRNVRGNERMPNAPFGDGLPSDEINDVMAASDGAIYTATPNGLAQSLDGGETWSFERGLNWRERVLGQLHVPPNVPENKPQERDKLLLEDWVSSLAEDESGNLWVGFQKHGFEIRDPASNRRLYDGTNANFLKGAGGSDWVRAILISSGLPPLLAHYGSETGGISVFASSPGSDAVVPVSEPTQRKFPTPPAAPTTADLEALTAAWRAKTLLQNPPDGVFLGEDWRTQGDWVGRYGRDYAQLFGVMSPYEDHKLDADPRFGGVERTIGPHFKEYKGVFTYISWLESNNPHTLYDPIVGTRRQAEINDGSWQSDKYPSSWEGPDLWVSFRVPVGVHRASLYFFNKDGHSGENRFRDYTVELKRRAPGAELGSEADDAQRVLAHSRVRDFWDGVYETFQVRGPGEFAFKIARHGSHVAMAQGVFLDNATEVAAPKPLHAMMDVLYAPPQLVDAAPGQTTLRAAQELWQLLDAAPDQSQTHAARLTAYRAAVAANAAPETLAAWRWKLKLWQAADREEFTRVMAQGYAALEAFRREHEAKAKADAAPTNP